ncbi:hypothetical protein ACRZ9H_004735, partial [Escherichia coli O51:H10]
ILNPRSAKPAPAEGWKPERDLGRPEYSGSRHWYAVRSQVRSKTAHSVRVFAHKMRTVSR